MVDWLADQIIEQCTPHGLPLDGDGGLLPALAAAAAERARSRRPQATSSLSAPVFPTIPSRPSLATHTHYEVKRLLTW